MIRAGKTVPGTRRSLRVDDTGYHLLFTLGGTGTGQVVDLGLEHGFETFVWHGTRV